MDVTFLAHNRRKRKVTKQDREKIEKRIREVPETSIKQVQHWFLTETGEAVCRETMRKYMKMSAKPIKRARALTSVWCDWMPQCSRTHRTIESGAVTVCPNQKPSTRTRASRSHVGKIRA